ncbi:alpha/beta hydrolase family protein [Pseudoduganella sp. GCM10020061]|uniref:S9 family peptidase n=1 Tax=Pseudoduganella sp. GCM10020061 TaxID=3317345 RepID=UPI00363E4545
MLHKIALFCLALCAQPVFASTPVPIEDLVHPDGLSTARLSPDGRYLAAIVFTGTNHALSLIDTKTRIGKTIVKGKYHQRGNWSYHKAPRDVIWAGNNLLAIDYGVEADIVDLNGKTVRNLGVEFLGRAQRGKPDSTQLLVYTDADREDVALCEATTGKCTEFDRPAGTPLRWAFDKHGVARAITVRNSAFWSSASTVSNWYRPAPDQPWVKLADSRITEDYWIPLYVPDEPGKLVVRSREGRDTYALFEYDVNTRRHGEVLAGHPTQDIVDVGGLDKSAFDYVETGGMVPQQVWFDPAWAAMQQTVDKLLPKRVNYISGNPSSMVLIYSFGDVDPGSWYLLDVAEKKLVAVLQSRLSINPDRMRPMEVITYKARDGLTIPAYLTRPANAAPNAPLVVMIHGGPHVRDTWSWDKEVQMLASRGYLVLQPQFRGSTGFGRKFEQAGYGQWGLAMQDDITAGVEELVRLGIADKNRVCIVGGSYGGYAALWGAVKTPDLYRCVVSFAGVTDIRDMFSDWSDVSTDKVGRELLIKQFGDLGNNAPAMDAVSPLRHAGRIKAKVMLAHGRDDIRVPVSHSKKMKAALEHFGHRVRWIEFMNEGHGLAYVASSQQYLTEMLEFIDENIGACAPAAKGCKPAAARQ